MIGVIGDVGLFGGADLLEEADNREGLIVSVAHLVRLAKDHEEERGSDGRRGSPGGKAPASGDPAAKGGEHSHNGAGEKKKEQNERGEISEWRVGGQQDGRQRETGNQHAAVEPGTNRPPERDSQGEKKGGGQLGPPAGRGREGTGGAPQ